MQQLLEILAGVGLYFVLQWVWEITKSIYNDCVWIVGGDE